MSDTIRVRVKPTEIFQHAGRQWYPGDELSIPEISVNDQLEVLEIQALERKPDTSGKKKG